MGSVGQFRWEFNEVDPLFSWSTGVQLVGGDCRTVFLSILGAIGGPHRHKSITATVPCTQSFRQTLDALLGGGLPGAWPEGSFFILNCLCLNMNS